MFDGLLQIHVGCGHHAHIDLLHLCRTDSHELTGLQHAQQTYLGREWQFGHLVQENGTSIGLFEVPFSRVDSPRERALLVSKQFRVDGAFGNGTAVDGNVFVVLARRECVNNLWEKLFAHTALARYQHR